MNRTENDLREALRELERRADERGAPPVAGLTAHATDTRPAPAAHRLSRWLAPAAAAAVVAGAAVTAAVVSTGGTSTSGHGTAPGGRPSASKQVSSSAPHLSPHRAARPSGAASILDDAATKLAATPWTTPPAQDFFYVHTNLATTWTSVSGERAGAGHAANGTTIWVPGCRNGQIVSKGEAGSCTLNDVPHYLADAPTTPAAWDAYLERMAPGAKAADAQGKIIVQVLHQDLTAPKAAAALLRYTETCPGLRVVPVQPVDGHALTGVTCTSMTNGSYGLAFDASTHAFVGYVGLNASGTQDGPAEIVIKTGIVPAAGRTP